MEEKKKKKVWRDFKFDLFGTTWYVKFVSDIKRFNQCPQDGQFYYGYTDAIHNVVYIELMDSNGNALDDKVVTVTLFHELTHCILGTGAYENPNSDEPLVEWTGRCIYSMLKQGVFEYAKPNKDK